MAQVKRGTLSGPGVRPHYTIVSPVSTAASADATPAADEAKKPKRRGLFRRG
jgi:hypothetical protein